jgi:hypothetical protein
VDELVEGLEELDGLGEDEGDELPELLVECEAELDGV